MQVQMPIAQQIILTLIALVIGFIFGGGAGFFFGWLLSQIYKKAPGLRRAFILIPWRTFLFSLIMISYSPVAITILRNFRGSRIEYSPVFIFPALIFMLFVEFFVADAVISQKFPVGLVARLAGVARTLAVTCGIFIAVGSYAIYNRLGVLGFAYMKLAATMKMDSLWTAFLVIMGVGFVLDLLLGLIEFLLVSHEGKKAARPLPPTQPSMIPPMQIPPPIGG